MPRERSQSVRITIVLGPFLPVPPAPTGAVEHVWDGLAHEFARLGHTVTVICRRDTRQGADETIDGVRYVRRTSFSRSGSLARDLVKDMWYSLRILGVLPRADILVLNTFFLPAIAPILRRGAGRTVVNVQRMPKGQLWLYDRCARLAVVSQAVEDLVREQRPRAMPRVRVIPNPIDTAAFVPPPDGRRINGPGTILYTGRIHPEKGLHLLVEAWHALNGEGAGVGLRLIGPWKHASGGGGEDYVRKLRDIAGGAEIEIGDPISDRVALADALRRADYYCYPSLADRGETFGVAPLEAMGTGLAPVVSDLACFRDFLRPGQNGMIFDHRAADAVARLTAALREMIADPQRRLRMGEAAAQTARTFSYSSVADQYLVDFEGLLGGSAGGDKV